MGIENIGQVCVMIHSGSRGFGHQVATGIIQCIIYNIGCSHNFLYFHTLYEHFRVHILTF